MKVDTDINSYFKEYKEGAQDELDKLEVKLTEAKTMAGTAKLRIDKDIKFINKAFQINLSDEEVYIKNAYIEDNNFIKYITKLYKSKDFTKDERISLAYIIRWIKCLERIHKYNQKAEIVRRRAKMTFKQYKEYVKRFYTQVQAEVLDGNAYRYSHGVGDLTIARVKNTKGKNYKGKINYAETRRRKQEIIDAGKIPYDAKEAKRCEILGKPYNGVSYIVYLNEPYFYQFYLANMMLSGHKLMKFTRTDYRGKSIRGVTDDELSIICKTEEDVLNLDADMGVKLKQLLRLNPSIYIKFIRDEEQSAFKHRETFRKNR